MVEWAETIPMAYVSGGRHMLEEQTLMSVQSGGQGGGMSGSDPYGVCL